MSNEAGVAILSIYIAGYLIGPMFWGPLSELYGRRLLFIIAFTGFTICQLASAFSPNAACLLTLRVLSGAFGVCPYMTSGGMITDIWNARARGIAMTWFVIAPFLGPALGPITGGYIYDAGLSWRWTIGVMTILSGTLLLSVIFFAPETYAPLLLKRKAIALRKSSGDERYYASLEQTTFSLRDIIVKIIARPLKMFFTEPMLAACAMYILYNNGCLYLFFEAYPVIFTEGHHLSAGTSGLMFVPVTIGGVVGLAIYAWIFEPMYLRKLDKVGAKAIQPEERLYMAMWGGPIFAISFFWMGWTSSPSISFWAPMMAGLPNGIAIIIIFISLTNYAIDVYLSVTASMLATMAITRNISALAFPLFARAMFVKMTPPWACTLLGCLATACSAILSYYLELVLD